MPGTGLGAGGSSAPVLVVRQLGQVAYQPTLAAMKELTLNRSSETPDQVWLLEHERVFTQGQAGKAEHVLAAGDIPVVQVDRGGQVTYHGPGQLVAYTLLDIKRLGLGVRDLVNHLEHSLVDVLARYGVSAYSKADAPGVYVDEAKIASLGLRIKKGCSYHGLALNLDMDLEPFSRINPCGYAGLAVTQLADLSQAPIEQTTVAELWVAGFAQRLGYGSVQWQAE